MRLKSYLRGIGIGILVTAAIFMISGGVRKESTMTDEQVKARAKELGMSEQITLVEPTTAAKEDSTKVEEPVPTTVAKVEDTNEEEAKAEADAKKEEVKAESDAKKEEVKAESDAKKEEAKAEPDAKKEEAKAEPDAKKEKVKAEPDAKKEEAKAESDAKKEEVKAEPDAKKEEAKAEGVTTEEVDNKTIIIVVNSGDSSETVSRKLFEAGIVADAREYDKYLMENGYDRTITVGNHKISVTASKEEIAKNLNTPTR